VGTASLLPLAVLYFEFGGREFCHQPYWAFIAKFYGSYFLFPIFGVIAAAFLIVPVAVLWSILDIGQYRYIRRYVTCAWLGLIALTCLIEFTGSPYAIFEVAPQTLNVAPSKIFYDRLETICTKTFAYKGNYKGPIGSVQPDTSYRADHIPDISTTPRFQSNRLC
jgi:hypothetical protein